MCKQCQLGPVYESHIWPGTYWRRCSRCYRKVAATVEEYTAQAHVDPAMDLTPAERERQQRRALKEERDRARLEAAG